MTKSFNNISEFANLSEEKQEELRKLSNRAYNIAKATGRNLKDFKKKIQNILWNSLSELSETKEINPETIEALFNNTIGKAQDALLETIENTYQEQLKTTDVFIFDGVVIEKILSVLQKILEFQRELDKMYGEGTSKKIIESLETLLIGVISTQLPLVGVFIKMSGFFDKINHIIADKNLLPEIKKWRGQIQTMQETLAQVKKFGPIYEKAEKTAEIAEKIEVAPHKVANLNLSKDSLEKANSEVNDNNSNESLKKVIEILESISINTKELEEKISKIKTDLEEIISINRNPDKLITAKKTISDTLAKTKEELLKVISPQTSFAEKISACCSAASNIKEIGEKLKTTLETSPNGKILVTTVENTIKKSVEAILPQGISNLKNLSPAIKNIVGITQTFLAVISKTEILSQIKSR